MMPARKRCHSARDSPGMTGASEVRPCLTALRLDSSLAFGSVRPSLAHWYEVRCDGEPQTSTGCHSVEKLFWSFGLWNYGGILELNYKRGGHPSSDGRSTMLEWSGSSRRGLLINRIRLSS